MSMDQLRAFMLNVISFIQTLMNYMVLSRSVTFVSNKPLTLYAGPIGFLWGAPRTRLLGHRVVHKIDYLYNNTRYTYVTKSLDPPWPPVEKPREMGFRAAVKSAVATMDDKDVRVTHEVNRLSGPRGDWHQRRFTPREVFGDNCSCVSITDVLGKVREIDGDESFYASSASTDDAK